MGIRNWDRSFGRLLLFAVFFLFLIPPAGAQGSLRVDRVAEDQKDPNWSFRMAYPRISGMANEEMQHRLNVEFMERAEAARARAVYASRGAAVTGSADFEVKRNQGGILSLVQKETVGSGAGAVRTAAGVTLDTVTGRRFLLCDLFDGDADYAATLDGLVKQRMAREGTQPGQRPFGPVRANGSFYLAADRLVLLFPQGGASSNAAGVKEFAIPLATLDGILKPQFILRT